MAEFEYRNEIIRNPRTDWGAVWSGVFTFVAIWSVFGALGFTIFAAAANPSAANPVTGMGAGIGVWVVILTIIAMYVAGRETSHSDSITNRHDGIRHGMIMFGLSVVSALVLTAFGGTAINTGTSFTAVTHSSYLLGVFAGIGWIGFVALFLGWLAAMGGASMTIPARSQSQGPQQVRPAA